jgi:UPF0755 protein
MRKSRAALLVVVLLAVAGAIGAAVVDVWYRKPLALPHSPFDFEVRQGMSLANVARRLHDAGVVPHAVALTWLARFRGVDRAIKAGSYEIEQGITLPALLAKLTQGDVTQTALTIVEGTTFAELKRVLRESTDVRHQAVDLPDAELLARIGATEPSPEGLFFPDTYLFGKGTRDIELLRQARDRMRKELDAAWATRQPDLPLADAYQALILASIVERETGLAAERPRIAGVFVERLRRGMRLQTDPAVIYGLGEKFDGNLRRADLERDGPYNTYTRAGLPPTPIALPSAEALRAAVQPEERGELFFVATGLGDGTHVFSKTLQEHEKAVRQYLVRYRQQQGGSGP